MYSDQSWDHLISSKRAAAKTVRKTQAWSKPWNAGFKLQRKEQTSGTFWDGRTSVTYSSSQLHQHMYA